MTVAIAAACQFEGHSAAVICADVQGTSAYLKQENISKLRRVGDASTALVADDVSQADELINGCHDAVRLLEQKDDPKNFDLDMNEYLAALRAAVQRRKAVKIDHYLKMSYGFSREEFYQNGKQWFTETVHREKLEEIRSVNLGASLIIVTLKRYLEDAVLITVDPEGGVHWESNYCAIGSGALIAHAVLARYDFKVIVPLEQCLFRVLAAKRTSEGDPNVGPQTDLEAMIQGGNFELAPRAHSYLSNLVGKMHDEPKLKFNKSTDLQKSKYGW